MARWSVLQDLTVDVTRATTTVMPGSLRTVSPRDTETGGLQSAAGELNMCDAKQSFSSLFNSCFFSDHE